MHTITYRQPELGDENQISGCLWASADLWQLTNGTPESVAEWLQLSSPEEIRDRILSRDITRVATWNGIVVGFIAFKRGNHLSLLFVRQEFARRGIGQALFQQCVDRFEAVTVNASETALGFYQKIGFRPAGDRFWQHGMGVMPMKWINPARSLLSTLRQLECELHQPNCRQNRERLAELLAADFMEFGRSGATYRREQTLRDLPTDPDPPQIQAQDFAVQSLSDSIALLTYRSAYINPSGELYRHTNRSSIWQQGSSGWQLLFHQGTPTDPFDRAVSGSD